ncbi:ABC transporter substrate-binding protein [Methanococcoides sp.]|uniref:ABC transporter substrate-binding protein n=1 Tax=Methanococcoides sp. TaxID=1966350 RepID=UPI00272E1714|nr:ABC transporter substrate-binding protein [Methanococcoides sp.]
MTGNKFLFGLVITAILLVSVPVSASGEYTLGIFGNSNEDNTINIEDVEYTERIILGLNDQTQLADARYDDTINMLDVTKIELINLGKEKDITLIDGVGRCVNVKMPVENIIPTDYRTTETLLAVGAKNMIVGVDRAFHERMSEFGLSDVPEVSMHGKFVDYEMVLMLEPDLVILPLWQVDNADTITENLPNTAVAVMGLTARKSIVSDLTTMGVLLGKEKEADELISWIRNYDNIIEERTEDLKLDEMRILFKLNGK